MNNTQPSRLNITVLYSVLAIVGLIALIILAAIAGDQFWMLVGGVAVAGVVLIGLAWVGVNLYSRWAEAQCKRDTLKFQFISDMADKGLLLKGRGIPAFEPLQLPEPELDDPIDMHGVTNSTVAPYHQDALEVVALSKQLMKARPDQIVPIAKAKMVEYFAGKEGYTRWHNGCAWLMAHQWVEERKKGHKVIGRFCTSGTVTQLYDRLSQK